MSEEFKTLKIDWRDFIGGPYEDCPKCRQHEFGVLNIHDTSYTRRCRSCRHTLTFVLPELRKKVIYLDQFVFSNIMKMLSPETPGHKRAKAEPLWRELFESLDVLCRMQLVICPDSQEHHDESLLSPFYDELKHTYEHFSTGISFYPSKSIEEMQIVEAFNCWMKNGKPEFNFDPGNIAHSSLHGWHDRIFITTNGTLSGYKHAVRRNRSNVHSRSRDLFTRWQIEKKSFANLFELEKAGYAESILRALEQDRQRALEVQSQLANVGPIPRSITEYSATMNSPPLNTLVYIARMQLLQKERNPGYAETEKVYEKAREQVVAFVKSGAMDETPTNIIAASMYAALARKAMAGQKKPPDEGMATDIRVASTLLPYCDAMFVDNFCRSLVNEIPQTHKLPYKCAVFSSKNSAEFVEYLSDIRKNATPEHLELLEEVYGPRVLQSPTSIYGVGKRKRVTDPT